MLIIVVFIAAIVAEESILLKESTPNLTGIKCVVSGKAASQKYFSRYKKGKVFFDCNNSRLLFEKSPGQFAIKANHHLVVTGQYQQKFCPITHIKTTKNNHQMSVAAVPIRFCCQECVLEFESKRSSIQQIEFLFSDGRFDKVFVVNKNSDEAGSSLKSAMR